jgi:hypothetical protein
MIPNEYLCMFSNEGDITVRVKFKDHDGFIANRQMNASEIKQLVSPKGKGFLTAMTFDDWPCEVYQYKIDPIANRLTIFARMSKEAECQS